MNIEEVEEPETTRITTQNEHRRSWSAETAKKYEFYCGNPVHPITTRSTRSTRKNEHRRSWSGEKVRELPRETRFQPCQDHRRIPKSTRITTKNEHRRSWRAGDYENSHTKPAHADPGQAESTRIPTKNEHASTKQRKLRRIVSATSDLAPRPFTITVRTPSVNHTVWGKTPQDKPICFGYNRGLCKFAADGKRCKRGFHVCLKCFRLQPFHTCQHWQSIGGNKVVVFREFTPPSNEVSQQEAIAVKQSSPKRQKINNEPSQPSSRFASMMEQPLSKPSGEVFVQPFSNKSVPDSSQSRQAVLLWTFRRMCQVEPTDDHVGFECIWMHSSGFKSQEAQTTCASVDSWPNGLTCPNVPRATCCSHQSCSHTRGSPTWHREPCSRKATAKCPCPSGSQNTKATSWFSACPGPSRPSFDGPSQSRFSQHFGFLHGWHNPVCAKNKMFR